MDETSSDAAEKSKNHLYSYHWVVRNYRVKVRLQKSQLKEEVFGYVSMIISYSPDSC